MRAYFNFDDNSFTAIGEYDVVVNFKANVVQLYKKADTKNTAAFLYNSYITDMYVLDDSKYEVGIVITFAGNDLTKNASQVRKVTGWLWIGSEHANNIQALGEQGGEFRTSITGTQIPPRPAAQQTTPTQQTTQQQTTQQQTTTTSKSTSVWDTLIGVSNALNQQRTASTTNPATPPFVGENTGTPDWVTNKTESNQNKVWEDIYNKNQGNNNPAPPPAAPPATSSGSNTMMYVAIGGLAVLAIYMMSQKKAKRTSGKRRRRSRK